MVNFRPGSAGTAGIDPLDRTFAALADPTRRQIVAALAAGPRTVGALADPLPMSLVAVSKHIAVLERAGLVSRTRQGRAHLCRLRPTPLGEAAAWLATYRRFWTGQLDALERFLTEEQHDQP
jgi:DNA-binding transcriptional ArsR family regulator